MVLITISGNRRFTMVCVAEAGNVQGAQMSQREISLGAAPAPQLTEPEDHAMALSSSASGLVLSPQGASGLPDRQGWPQRWVNPL